MGAGGNWGSGVLAPSGPASILPPSPFPPGLIWQVREKNRVECRLPLYNIVQYSKFGLLRRAATADPFGSHFFFWLDAGAGRWLAPFEALVPQWPDPAKLAPLKPGLLQIQALVPEPWPACNATAAGEAEHLWGNLSYLVGTFFGGDRAALERTDGRLLALFEEMLAAGRMNNEQIALWVLRCRHVDEFTVFPRAYATEHALRLQPIRKKDSDWLPLIANLARRRSL